MSRSFSVNPITKIILILLMNVMLFSGGDTIYIKVATWYAILLIFLSGKQKAAYRTATVYLMISFLHYLIGFAPKVVVSTWGLIMYPILLFMPLYVYAILTFVTTESSDLQAALQKLRVPNKMMITILVIFRFLPSLRSEAKNIKAAMELKGISKNPLKTVEHIYVPLLFHSINIGDELSASAYTRGMGLYKEATPLKQSKFGFLDIASICFILLLIAMRKEMILL